MFLFESWVSGQSFTGVDSLQLQYLQNNSSMKFSEYHRAAEIAKIQFVPALVTSLKNLIF